MYTAALLNDGPHSILVRPIFGENFDLFIDDTHQKEPRWDDATTADAAIATLEQMPAGKAFFFWVHFFGAHAPDEVHPDLTAFGSQPEDGMSTRFSTWTARSRVLRKVEARAAQTSSPVAIVVTADHGEQFMPFGRDHGFDLSDESIHVPLVVKAPGLPAAVRTDMVSLVDFMPTILGLTETPAPAPLDGIDIRTPPLPGQPPRIFIAEAWRLGSDGTITNDKGGRLRPAGASHLRRAGQ